jgi:hypothetical protein
LPAPRSAVAPKEERPMTDFILLTLGFALFALTISYAIACDRL